MRADIDEVDLSILQSLQEDARTPFTRIAKKLGVSDATVHLRVRKMEDAGLIEEYSTLINEERVGKPITAYVFIRVNPGTVEDVCARLTEVDEVYEVSEIHERYDVLSKVRGSSLEDLRDILTGKIRSIPQVMSSETYTVYKNWKRDRGVKIKNLINRA